MKISEHKLQSGLLVHHRSFTLQNQSKNQKNDDDTTRRTPKSVYPVRIKPGKGLVQVKGGGYGQDEKQKQKRQPGIKIDELVFEFQVACRPSVDIER